MPAIIFNTLIFYVLFPFSILNPEVSASGSEDDNERNDAAEEETDDDDTTFFDTRDFISSSSSVRASSFSSDDEGISVVGSEGDIDPSIRSVGTNYPHVKRRKKLPEPVEKEKGVSLWSLIKDNIGKDLTKVCLPVYFNEPLSSLQRCCEEMEYSYLLDRAYEWGKRVSLDLVPKFHNVYCFSVLLKTLSQRFKTIDDVVQGNTLMRILNVAAFAVSAYASTDGRNCKPFNPLLGETYEAEFPDKGFRFISEKV